MKHGLEKLNALLRRIVRKHSSFRQDQGRKLSASWLLALCMMFSCWTASICETHSDTILRNHIDLRFGMMMHFNMNTYYPGWANNRVNPLLFNPTSLDCGQWARAAKAAGMKYGLLTCKHHDGFVIWQTNVPPLITPAYTIKQSSQPNMDVVSAYCDSFRAYGLLPGIYMSMFDVAQGIGYLTTSWTPAQKAYLLGQLTELLTKYGPIPLICFDGWSWCMVQKNIPMDIVGAILQAEVRNNRSQRVIAWSVGSRGHVYGRGTEGDLLSCRQYLWFVAGPNYHRRLVLQWLL